MKIRKIKNKKGFLLGEVSVKLVIAILSILILIILGAKLFGMFSKENDVKKAENNLNLIADKIAYLNSPEYTEDFLYVTIFPPEKIGWFIKSYSPGDFPEKQCSIKDFESCLCMCEEDSIIKGECLGLMACIGFEQEIVVEKEFKTEEITMIQGISKDIKCNYWYQGEKWNNNAASSCVDLSGEDYENGILMIRNSHDMVSFDGEIINIVNLISSPQELKIIKENEIIKIKESDRQ